MMRTTEAPQVTVSGVWRGEQDVSTLLLVVHSGRGRNAQRQLLYPGLHVGLDGRWSARVSDPVEGVWAVPHDGHSDPDAWLCLSASKLQARSVGTVRLLARQAFGKLRANVDEGELKAILALPPQPFPALPDRKLLQPYRDICDFLKLDLDTELYKLTQNDLDRAQDRYRRSARHRQVIEILQMRLNSRDAVRTYFHLCKTLLNSVSIDAGNFIERASAWMSLTSKKPGKPVNEFFKLFLQVAALIMKFVEQGAGKTVVETTLSVIAIFQNTVQLVDGDRKSYPNLDKVHLAKAELLGALTDWKRAIETNIDDTQALILRDAAKLERAGKLVFPEKTAPILKATELSWGRIIWLKLLPTRTVLVKDGSERHERKKFNSDDKKIQAYVTEKLNKSLKSTAAKDLRTVTWGYFKSTTGNRHRKFYYSLRRWVLRLGANAETDFNLEAARSLRACGITPHDMIISLKLPIRCFSGTPGIPPKDAKNLWTDVYWVGAHGRRHYMNYAQWDPVGKKGKGK